MLRKTFLVVLRKTLKRKYCLLFFIAFLTLNVYRNGLVKRNNEGNGYERVRDAPQYLSFSLQWWQLMFCLFTYHTIGQSFQLSWSQREELLVSIRVFSLLGLFLKTPKAIYTRFTSVSNSV